MIRVIRNTAPWQCGTSNAAPCPIHFRVLCGNGWETELLQQKEPKNTVTPKPRCLILSCGHTLRSENGVGPWLSEWASEHDTSDSTIVVITRR
jgi:hypothetical protein